MTTTGRPTVECPGCGKTVALRKDGLLWHHNTGKPAYSGALYREHCRRSGTALTELETSR